MGLLGSLVSKGPHKSGSASDQNQGGLERVLGAERGHRAVRADHVQVLVPVLGKDIGLTKKDRNGDWVTYVTTVDEAIALGNELAIAMTLSS